MRSVRRACRSGCNASDFFRPPRLAQSLKVFPGLCHTFPCEGAPNGSPRRLVGHGSPSTRLRNPLALLRSPPIRKRLPGCVRRDVDSCSRPQRRCRSDGGTGASPSPGGAQIDFRRAIKLSQQPVPIATHQQACHVRKRTTLEVSSDPNHMDRRPAKADSPRNAYKFKLPFGYQQMTMRFISSLC